MANARRDGPPDGRQADAPEFLERLSSAPWVICSMLIHMLALILFSSIVWRDLGPERNAAMLTAWLGPETSEVVSPDASMLNDSLPLRLKLIVSAATLRSRLAEDALLAV